MRTPEQPGSRRQKHQWSSHNTKLKRPTVGLGTYRTDPLYPRIVKAMGDVLQRGNAVAPVDVLIGMGLLTAENLEAWRKGRVG